MQSWIVAVGDELLSGHTQDSNSNWLAARLRESAYPCTRIVVVPDRVPLIRAELELAREGPAERVFCCGGLGPTPDDRTMAAVAAMLQVPLVEDRLVLARMKERVARRFREGLSPSAHPNSGTLKMALIPKGAPVLRNPVGGAPPLAVPLPSARSRRWLFVLPGVPPELRAVFDQEIAPRYLKGGRSRCYRERRYEGVAESTLFPALSELERSHPRVLLGSYPQPGGGLVIRASGRDLAEVEAALLALERLRPGGMGG